jgi:CHAT domain-containing protein
MRLRASEFDSNINADLGVASVIAMLAAAGRVDAAFELAERRRARELVDRMARAEATRTTRDSATRPRHHTSGATVQDLVRILPDSNTALLEYVTGRGGEPTTLFVVTQAGAVARQLPSIDSLSASIDRLRTVMEAGGDARPLGRRLHEAILEPAISVLGRHVTRLVIVTDDVLARVPFDALVLADDRYAVERFAISMAPSASTWLALVARPANARLFRLLAIGDPVFESSRSASGEALRGANSVYRSAFDASGGLGRLPSSRREARAVARFAPSAEVRLRRDASEAYLLSTALDTFRVLHFATHALIDEESTARTALALTPGLGHDGFVSPADLAGLKLDADLVVLSACRTAAGVVLRGEGVQGLTAPLLEAGARSVVATGWRIPDAGAATMVERFYRAMAGGATVSDALRIAKLEALRAGAPATEWAAFIAVGDPMVRIPLVIPSSPASRPAWIVAFAVALAVAIAAYGWARRNRSDADAASEPSAEKPRTDHTYSLPDSTRTLDGSSTTVSEVVAVKTESPVGPISSKR